MTLFPPLLAKSDGFGDIAQLLIFVVLAIGAAIQQALKKRAEERKRTAGTQPHEHEPTPEPAHDHREPPPRPPPPRPSTPRRPPQPARPVPDRRPLFATARTQTPSLSAHGLAQPGHGGRVAILADPEKRRRALHGRALLFAKAPSPHDRVRAAVLWHEVLGPPPALGG